MSEPVLAQIKRAIKNTMKECVELSEPDALLPLSERTGTAYVLALRPWQYSGFDEFPRDADAGADKASII
jgi:hypothetical protein